MTCRVIVPVTLLFDDDRERPVVEAINGVPTFSNEVLTVGRVLVDSARWGLTEREAE